jgi:hypothetical protein
MPNTLYMVVEHFKNKDAVAVYRRFRDSGRMAPEGLTYVSSWVDDKLERCYQLMDTQDRRLLDEWMMTARVSGRTRAAAAGSEENRAQTMTLRAAALFHR